MEDQLLSEKAESQVLVVGVEEVVVTEALMPLDGLASMRALLVDSPPEANFQNFYFFFHFYFFMHKVPKKKGNNNRVIA